MNYLYNCTEILIHAGLSAASDCAMVRNVRVLVILALGFKFAWEVLKLLTLVLLFTGYVRLLSR